MNIPCDGKHALSSELRSNLSASWTGMIHWDVTMADYCTFRAGGKAEGLLVASTRTELATLMSWLRRNEVCWRVIGRGSNILVKSQGFSGVVIVLGGDFCSVDCIDDQADKEAIRRVRVGAGSTIASLVGWCSRNEISGLEFMVGIPGSVGGAVCMNAGAWGHEIGNCIETVTYVDKEGIIYDVTGDDLGFSYRQLQLKEGSLEDAIIIETVLRLKPGRQKEMIEQCRQYLDKRREKQPLGVASAGSFFKNPAGDSAGRLIDEAGLKGLCKGQAMVSTKHANFIVNAGQASADDIIELMKEVQEKVYLHSGVMLEPEVHLL